MNSINQIPIDHEPTCEGEMIFQRYQKKEIPIEEYQKLNAQLVAAGLEKDYLPIRYPEPSSQIQEYVSGRINGKAHDKFQSRATGTWINAVSRANNTNMCNLNLLFWSKTKCEENNLKHEADKLDRAISRLKAILPNEEQIEFIRKASKARQMDSQQ